MTGVRPHTGPGWVGGIFDSFLSVTRTKGGADCFLCEEQTNLAQSGSIQAKTGLVVRYKKKTKNKKKMMLKKIEEEDKEEDEYGAEEDADKEEDEEEAEEEEK